jgi:PAS domain S-box-containing protein
MIDTSDVSVYARLLQATLNSASDAFVVTGSRHAIVEWSEKAEYFFGGSAQEADGRSFWEMRVPQRMRLQHEQALEKHLQIREISGQRMRTGAMRKDGRQRPVELAITPFLLNQETFCCIEIRDSPARVV